MLARMLVLQVPQTKPEASLTLLTLFLDYQI